MDKLEINTSNMSMLSKSRKTTSTFFVSSIFVTFLGLLSSTFGTSSMGLCSNVAKTGVFYFPFLLVCAIVVNFLSYKAFIHLTDKYQLTGFSDYSTLVFGEKYKFINDFLLILMNTGNLVANCVLANLYICNTLIQLGVTNTLFIEKKSMIWITIMILSTFPLTIKQKLKDLLIVNFFTLFIILFLVGFTIYNFLENKPSENSQELVFINLKETSSVYSYLFFCFICQQNLIILYNEMKDRSKKKIMSIIKIHFGFMFIVYFILGMLAYFVFFNNPLVKIKTFLDLFEQNSKAVIFANFLLILMCIIGYIFTFKPTRDLLENYLIKTPENEDKDNDLRLSNVMLTLFLILAIFLFNILVIKLELGFLNLIGIISNFIAPILFIFVPFYFYMKDINDFRLSIFLLLPLICYFLSLFFLI